jgi:tetrahydromethanopterin S-methyltransferase subunit E
LKGTSRNFKATSNIEKDATFGSQDSPNIQSELSPEFQDNSKGSTENINFIKSNSGEPISGHNMLVGNRLSATLMSKFYQFSENIHSF